MKRMATILMLTAVIMAATPVMTNATIEAMVSGGVPLPVIVRAIRTAARIELFTGKHDYARLTNAGASIKDADRIMEAIRYREYNGIDGSPVVEHPVVEQVASVTEPAPSPAAPVPVSVAASAPSPVAPAAAVAPRVPVHHIILEDGTPVHLRISRNLSSADTSTNETVDFEVLEEVRIGDQIVIPKGSVALGTVTEAEQKKRMGRAGKLDVTIDSVRLSDGEKVALRGVKNVKGGGHVGAVTTGVVLTALVVWPAAPLFLLMHGKDVTIAKGTEITAYISGNATLDSAKFQPAI